jgi:formate-dependent nitrite reductase membrane component NrfD
LLAFIAFIDAVLFGSRLVHTPAGLIGKILSVLGAIAGLALAGYTGVLVNVTNIPVWGDSPWLGALFLFSGISTGIALLMVVGRRVAASTVEKLSEADNYMMIFELVSLIVFVATLGAVGLHFIFGAPVLILFLFVVIVGLLLPLAIHWRPALAGGARRAVVWSSVLVLIGGFVLRWAVLAGPQGIGL